MVWIGKLTQEVVEEILSKLPPESLIQSKCVSKPWYSLINFLEKDQAFVAKHLHNMKASSSTSLLVSMSHLYNHNTPEENYEESISLLTLHDNVDKEDTIHCFIEDLSLPNFLGENLDMAFIQTYHCNGIICLVNDFDSLMLWNPVLHECKILQETHLHNKSKVESIGFGYDSRAKDYKIVRVFSEEDKFRAELYTLSTNSWKEINVPTSGCENFRLKHPNVPINHKGVCYWFVNGDKDQTVLISFDICDEVFHSISLPNNPQIFEMSCTNLAIWNDLIYLFWYLGQTEFPKSIHMWVMDGCCYRGDRGFCSWRKYLTIGPLEGVQLPMAFWKSDELLMDTDDGIIASYNLSTQKLRNIFVHREVEILLYTVYVKSMVSLKEIGQA